MVTQKKEGNNLSFFSPVSGESLHQRLSDFRQKQLHLRPFLVKGRLTYHLVRSLLQRGWPSQYRQHVTLPQTSVLAENNCGNAGILILAHTFLKLRVLHYRYLAAMAHARPSRHSQYHMREGQ